MHTFFAKRALVGLAVLCLLSLGTHGTSKSDDGGKDDDSTAKPAPKTDASKKTASGLTEREQWMLDRIEQLEKRVAELESKGPSNVSSGASAAAPRLS